MDSNSILQAQPLLYPISLASDDFTVYVSTTDLGKVGVLNGDWAVVRSCSGFRSRFVRVFANDELVTQAGVLIASPILVHNIHGSATTSSQSVLVALRASPFGSRPPPIRTARTLTIARVASPCTIDRAYQPIFLNALKGYFDGRRRLIKQGDLLALAIDTDHIASPSESIGESVELEANRIEAPETFDSTLIPNEMVCFRVTNVESDEGDIRASTDCSNLHSGFIDGEYGCWSDSSLTRMVQSGVEYSLVPDAARYLGLERTLPISSIAQKLLASNALADETPSSKLFAITAAALMPKASTFDIHLSVLLKGVAGVGKFTAARLIGQHLGLHILEINCYHLLGENDTKSEGTLRARFEKAKSCSPCILILRHVDALAQTSQAPEPGKEPMLSSSLRDCIDDLENTWKFNGHPVFIYGTTCDATKMSSTILSCFKHEVTFQVPSEIERLDILSSLLLDVPTSPDVSPSMVARQTAALVAGDIVDLVARAKYASIERVVQSTSSNLSKADVSHAGVPLSALDFDVGLAQARAAYSESIGAPKIPSVSWEDVGGLAHVKSEILDTIQLPLEHPELFASGLKKRSGILLYGPPGTGKTLLAKAVATSCSLNFFSVKGPELLNMYIGESEANVRRVFQRARDAKPCVIFFDELDSVAPKRGSHGDSGGVMDRIVSQLLAELDGMSTGKGSADVFVIGATNRPDLLDPALLRPGRFDRLLYLGVSDTHQAQLNILSALTRKFRLHPSLDLLLVAKQCPFNYTGADFYALCSDALLNAMSRKALELDDIIAGLNQSHSLPGHPYPLTPQYYLSEVASPQEIEVLVLQEDFDSALRNLTPSVSQHEMEHYGRIQARFSQNLRDGTE
ncbi:hypothetical protein JAAARDRAFT_153154 [Jaapia argillacea MUCL 33604]|uniref:Peroxisomal ATPase PEX6 n=1 Tax=Jaapia argillacea MUCL 33604 TaxID=933084 RepID=A0A067PX35_9AGAM|nr:hypothetical protein JAAARDRAFT_153154 [Jaapia argillacea MUCL 33604]